MYYPRFGFVIAVHIGLGCEYGVPDEVFRVIEPEPGCLTDATGIIRSHVAFSGV